MPTSIATCQINEWIHSRLEKGARQATRQRHAECIAVSRRVLAGDEAVLAGDSTFEHPAVIDQYRQPVRQQAGSLLLRQAKPRNDLLPTQIAELQQQVVDAVRIGHGIFAVEQL